MESFQSCLNQHYVGHLYVKYITLILADKVKLFNLFYLYCDIYQKRW